MTCKFTGQQLSEENLIFEDEALHNGWAGFGDEMLGNALFAHSATAFGGSAGLASGPFGWRFGRSGRERSGKGK